MPNTPPSTPPPLNTLSHGPAPQAAQNPNPNLLAQRATGRRVLAETETLAFFTGPGNTSATTSSSENNNTTPTIG